MRRRRAGKTEGQVMANDVAVREAGAVTVLDELSVEQVIGQIQKIQGLMAKGMKAGEHYGVIPGTGSKPSLLKPGAEKLCLMFRLDPEYAVDKHMDGRHLTIDSTCTLYHIGSGARMGSGMGSCSTMESKYAYRKGARSCPACGKEETIIKGKAEYGAGWLCFARKGGCGAKFKDGDPLIEGQSTDRVANPDVADQYNTILKMANKRSLVAAVLNVTAASDIFTQDLEDIEERGSNPKPPAAATEPIDKASKEQRQSLVKMARQVLGGKDQGDDWLKVRVSSKEITLAEFQDLTQKLVAIRAQDEAVVESFDAEQVKQAPDIDF